MNLFGLIGFNYSGSQQIFGPSDFNKNVEFMEAFCDLAPGQNVVDVELKGKPGSMLTVKILMMQTLMMMA